MIQVKKFLKLYQDPKLLIIFLLGIVSGLPLAMVGSNFSIWLTEAGISRSTIGFMSLVFMPYSLRFIWSPLLDTVKLPNFLGFNVDNRCRWMIALIIATAGFIFMASQLDLKADIAVAAILMIAITSCSATLDSAIDGYRISITPDDQQAAAAAMATTGYRGGMLISGGGGLAMAEYYGWALTYKAVASLMLASILVVLIASKCCKVMADKIEESKQSSFSELLRIKLIEPIKALIKVDSVWLILIFIAIFRLGDSFLHTMNSPLLIELGYRKIEIAYIVKTLAPIATIIGGILGGYLGYMMSMRLAVAMSAILMAITNLGFLWLYYQPHNLYYLGITMVIENFSTGIGSTIFVGFISRYCQRRFAASHYSILASFALIGRNMLSAPAGIVVDNYGWPMFFAASIILAIPALLMIWLLPQLFRNNNLTNEQTAKNK